MSAQAPVKVFGYIRESTDDQFRHGYRPARQKERIERYCERHNFKLVQWFEDAGSARDVRKRPDFKRMIAEINQKEDIMFIVVDEISRFFRNIEETMLLEKELFEQGIYVIDTVVDYSPREYLSKGQIDPSLWRSRINARVDAEQERRRTGYRVKDSLEGKRSKGQYVGPLAYGLKWVGPPEVKRYVDYDEEEAAVIKEIFHTYLTANVGFTELAKRINEKGYRRKSVSRRYNKNEDYIERNNGLVKFTNDIVRKILTNKSYIGVQNFEPFGQLLSFDGSQPVPLKPLIDPYDFARIQELMAQNARRPRRRKRTSKQKRTYVLQGLLYSGVNGTKMHAQTDQTKSGETRRYMAKSNKQGNDVHIPSIRADEIEAKVIELLRMLDPNDIDTIESILRALITNEVKGRKKDPKYAEQERVRQSKELDKTIQHLEMLQQESYTVEFERTLAKLKRRKAELAESSGGKQGVDFYNLEKVRTFFGNIHEEFDRFKSLAAKQELVSALFTEVFTAKSSKKANLIGIEEDYKMMREHKAESKELGFLLKKYAPMLFERIYAKKDGDILEVRIEPTGLLLLLADKDVKSYENPEKGPAPKKKVG